MVSAAGEVWPYPGLSGILICWTGIVVVSVQSPAYSDKVGSDVDAWLATLDLVRVVVSNFLSVVLENPAMAGKKASKPSTASQP